MEWSKSSIQSLVSEFKKEVFSNENLHEFVSSSAYDTAWLAMIPDDPRKQNCPMFENCLNWILKNQNQDGFWGETNDEGLPTIDTLPATLACMVALQTWNVGQENIDKGLAFVYSKAEILLKIHYQNLPRWFVIVFPAMITLAQDASLELVFPQGSKVVIDNIFFKRQQILKTEELVDKSQYCDLPLLAYVESLPSTYNVQQKEIVKHLGNDGSLFQSPSATAYAFMATGNIKCRRYLMSLVQNCPNGGVPVKYPMDEELIKLGMVDRVQRLGLAEHFNEEIEKILAKIYRDQKNHKAKPEKTNTLLPIKLYKDSLAFRLLRMQGYEVNPGNMCWFLNDAEMLKHIEENCEQFITVMYSVYTATDLLFPGEYELEEARKFAKRMLERSIKRNKDHNFVLSKRFHNVIKHELKLPWIARLDHLDHRKWIEEYNVTPLWIGKTSFYRLSCLDKKNLMQLAVENYEFRQLIYRNELEELKRWSMKWGLSDMGFGREKTTYLYFAIAASNSLPLEPIVRLIGAKAGIIITVADDFYDMEGSLSELEVLTDAVKRWDGKGLQGHGKTIFNVLDDLVKDITSKCHTKERSGIEEKIRDIWRETFVSWMVEKTWSHSGYIPSVNEYLQTAMISIAAHTLVLPASCILNPGIPIEKLKPAEYENITKLLMAITRLLNDTRSYQKEKADGKMNLVLLHLNENPESHIDESIAYVEEIVGMKWKEFLKHVLMDGFDDMPKPCKNIHLSCLKAFQMFFNSSNLFDSKTALADDIKKAIYLPIDRTPKHFLKPLPSPVPAKKDNITKISAIFYGALKNQGSTSVIKQQTNFGKISIKRPEKVHIPVRFHFCFI
ncbi:geranyllinalool synthase [Forsythia ovata]|uniref:Geranyllinalool synthase n=1 Tax=Forsythia ovata TaxID=205694 RepID=A0ABD1S5L6_9LAMI